MAEMQALILLSGYCKKYVQNMSAIVQHVSLGVAVVGGVGGVCCCIFILLCLFLTSLTIPQTTETLIFPKHLDISHGFAKQVSSRVVRKSSFEKDYFEVQFVCEHHLAM